MTNTPLLGQLFSLVGRTALVTGSSGGIGAAIAKGLAGAGATVALNGRNEARLMDVQREIEAAGGSADVFPADVGDLDAVRDLARAATERLGQVDILVNCAGMNKRMPIAEMTPDIYDSIMATNLRGLYFLTQALVPRMAERGGGKIINIGSLTSTIGLQDVSVYGMTKSALAELTKTMAIEWAEHNIQVNCICPGFIRTELTEPVWNDSKRSTWILNRLPNKRPGAPEDMVGIAIYLASPASDYTTGQSIYIDGGFTAGSQWNG